MSVYLVKTPSGNRLVEARTPSAAISFVINKGDYQASAVNTSELSKYVREGMDIESAMPQDNQEAA